MYFDKIGTICRLGVDANGEIITAFRSSFCRGAIGSNPCRVYRRKTIRSSISNATVHYIARIAFADAPIPMNVSVASKILAAESREWSRVDDSLTPFRLEGWVCF